MKRFIVMVAIVLGTVATAMAQEVTFLGLHVLQGKTEAIDILGSHPSVSDISEFDMHTTQFSVKIEDNLTFTGVVFFDTQLNTNQITISHLTDLYTNKQMNTVYKKIKQVLENSYGTHTQHALYSDKGVNLPSHCIELYVWKLENRNYVELQVNDEDITVIFYQAMKKPTVALERF